MFNLRCIKRWGRTGGKRKADIKYGEIFPGCVQKVITSRKIWVSFKALFFRFKFFQSLSLHHFSRCSCFGFLWDRYWRCSVADCVFKLVLKWVALFIFNLLVSYFPFTFVCPSQLSLTEPGRWIQWKGLYSLVRQALYFLRLFFHYVDTSFSPPDIILPSFHPMFIHFLIQQRAAVGQVKKERKENRTIKNEIPNHI